MAEQAPFQSRLVEFGAHTVYVGLELVEFAVLNLGEEGFDYRLEACVGFRQVDDLPVARGGGLLFDPADQV